MSRGHIILIIFIVLALLLIIGGGIGYYIYTSNQPTQLKLLPPPPPLPKPEPITFHILPILPFPTPIPIGPIPLQNAGYFIAIQPDLNTDITCIGQTTFYSDSKTSLTNISNLGFNLNEMMNGFIGYIVRTPYEKGITNPNLYTIGNTLNNGQGIPGNSFYFNSTTSQCIYNNFICGRNYVIPNTISYTVNLHNATAAQDSNVLYLIEYTLGDLITSYLPCNQTIPELNIKFAFGSLVTS